MIENFDESTMIGTRAMSGSAATRFKNLTIACSEIEQALVHVDVDDLRAGRHLIARHVERGGEIAVLDQFAESGGAGDVGALADINEANVGREGERLQPGEAQARLYRRDLPRRDAFHALGDRMNMRWRRAATAADDIDEPGVGEFADERGHVFGALVIKAEFVGQAGVRVSADERVGDPRELGEMGAHFARAECAVKPDAERASMAQRMPEGGRRLARQRAAGEIGYGTGNHDRQLAAGLFEYVIDADERRLGVQRIEDRLDQQNVRAAFDERLGGFGIGSAQLIE